MWRCAGVRWGDGVPRLEWVGGRVSELRYGQVVGFRAVGARVCVGARGNACPTSASVPGRSTGGRCAECARLERAHSVAADTIADDPRTYRVYLAWFGGGMTKVGITAEARGAARLLEQGAVAFCWLGRGPLMAARRTEEVLRHALAVPDRIPYARKRAVRHALPGAEARAREVEELYRRVVAVPRWDETLEPVEFVAYDHGEAFRLDGLPALDGTVTELVDGGTVAGRLLAAAGPDLHLLAGDGRCLVLDTRLLSGWELVAAPADSLVTVPLTAAAQDGLF
ncbi:DUF2797 domain-containing protein [Streptomyces solicathayae]|uniref:DUF2797 domain-containing protein n=1 Tax=Streptomyces solicathayae TaxID=3081768 RepID=A0ABZ0LV39_9ACTN|nr:DUF2797 domain-containing protein [Streptomyces sp. HUAS YS2]WOX23378.1 DUF2797 domain-containing protein [Streptomyces sp. HUAS YS2]